MDTDDATLLSEFYAVYPWTSKDRVVIEQMVMYLARKRQNVFVEVMELETHILNSTDAEGIIIGVLAWSACDREGAGLWQ